MRRWGAGPRVHTASALVMGAAAGMVLLSGCGADVQRAEATATADRFVGYVTTAPSEACGLLAPRTLEAMDGGACPRTLATDDLPAPGPRLAVTVAGHSAQVRYARGTVFLALFD